MISKKYKHNDIIVSLDARHIDTLKFGRVLRSRIFFHDNIQDIRAYTKRAKESGSFTVVIEWLNDKTISWLHEDVVKLATPAEKILYATTNIKKA